MKYYIASGFENKKLVHSLITKLNSCGMMNTYNWTLNNRVVTKDDLKRIGTLELNAVKEAEVLIAILPGGKGTHVEIGIALGNSIPVILVYLTEQLSRLENASTFYYVESVHHLDYKEENFVDELKKKMEGLNN